MTPEELENQRSWAEVLLPFIGRKLEHVANVGVHAPYVLVCYEDMTTQQYWVPDTLMPAPWLLPLEPSDIDLRPVPANAPSVEICDRWTWITRSGLGHHHHYPYSDLPV
jgi:hypothetical protein